MKLTEPFVSICIPTFNQINLLSKLLYSIKIQTYKDFEIVISDDSTTDEVGELVSDFSLENPELSIQYKRNQLPLGSPSNWNQSILLARGKWIKIMHHDDCFCDEYSLLNYVKLSEFDNNISFVFSGSIAINNENKSSYYSINNTNFLEIQFNPYSLIKGNLIGAPSAVMFKKNNLNFDEKLIWLVDIDFYLCYFLSLNPNQINYTEDFLVNTFMPIERITNECWMNPKIEVPEYLYLIHKHRVYSFGILNFVVELFLNMKVNSLKKIYFFASEIKVNFLLILILYAKKSSFFRFYLKLRNLINF